MNIKELFNDFLRVELNLDYKQFAAVMADIGREKSAYRLLITAPAGSGKTRVLASRYLKLLVYGEKPENIVAITFTRKAAKEMKERIITYLYDFKKRVEEEKNLNDSLPFLMDSDSLIKSILKMRISTIDSFLSSIIRLFPGEAGVDPNSKIISEVDEEEIIDDIIDEVVEKKMKSDGNIIELLSFFDFNYSPLSPHQQTGFLPTVRNIIKNWDNYYLTFNNIDNLSQDEIINNLKIYIGKNYDQKKLLSEFKDTINEFKKMHKDTPANINEFFDFICNNPIEEIIKKRDKFIRYYDIFVTNKITVRVHPKIGTKNKEIKEFFKQEIASLYKRCMESFLLDIDIERSLLSPIFAELIHTIIKKVKKRKKEMGVLGMGDLKTITYGLLTKHTERFNILYNMDARVNHYLIDEFQDTDPIQWTIFQKLTEDWFAGESVKQESNILPTIFLVGDEKQSIYGFRNADVRIITEMKEEENLFTETFSLIKNYRSKKEIIDTVNQLFKDKMKRDKHKPYSIEYEKMLPHKEGVGKVKIVEFPLKGNKNVRITQVAKTMADFLPSLKEQYKSWGSIALLFRASTHFNIYEEEFDKRSIPYISSGGKSFFKNREIIEIIKILNFLDNPYDDIKFAELFLSPIFDHKLEDFLRLSSNVKTKNGNKDNSLSLFETFLLNYGDEYPEFYKLICEWLDKRDRTPYVQLIEDALMDTNSYGILADRKGGQKDVNIRKLLNLIEHISEEKMNFSFFYERLNRIIRAKEKNADIDVGVSTEEEEEDIGAIHIMTVHKAKGLEFPVVILPEIDLAKISVRRKSKGIRIDRDTPVLLFLKQYGKFATPLQKKFVEKEKNKREEELKRLFYVALTRAQDELYLFSTGKEIASERTWLNIVYDSPIRMADTLEIPIVTEKEKIITTYKESSIYNFSESKGIISIKYTIRPSKIEKEVSPYSIDVEKGKLKGTIMHKLFELLASEQISVTKMENISKIVKEIALGEDEYFIGDKEFLNEIETQFRNVLNNKEIMKIVKHKKSLNEFPFSIEKVNENGESIEYTGVMDKVIFEDDAVEVYDYKTNTPYGESKKNFIARMKNEYKHQMEVYKFAAKKLFKNKNVRVYFIFTSILEIVEAL